MKTAHNTDVSLASDASVALSCLTPDTKVHLVRALKARLKNPFSSAESLRAQMAQGITFQMLANVLGQASSFLSLLIAARLLGKEQYGRFALIQSTVNTFIGVGALGLGITATKYVSEYRVRAPERVGRVLGLSCSIATVAAFAFAAAYLFACPLMVSGDYVGRIQVGAICVFFTALNGYQLGALAGFENFRTIARVSAIAACLNPVATAVLAHYFALMGALAALSLNSVIVWCFYHFAVKGECRRWNCAVAFHGILAESRCLFTMSAPASLSGIVASLATWISTLMLSKQSNGLDQLALWSAANSLRLMVMFIPLILVRVMMPRLNFLRAHTQERPYAHAFRIFILSTACTSGGMGLFLAICSQQLLSLFGKGFVDADGVVHILLLSAVIEAVAGSLSQALVVQGRMWHQMATMAAWSLVLVAITRITAHAGARGIAIANLVAWSVAVCIYFGVARIREETRWAQSNFGGVTNE
jgi:O-antigen/teichoic acid export membrane protein